LATKKLAKRALSSALAVLVTASAFSGLSITASAAEYVTIGGKGAIFTAKAEVKTYQTAKFASDDVEETEEKWFNRHYSLSNSNGSYSSKLGGLGSSSSTLNFHYHYDKATLAKAIDNKFTSEQVDSKVRAVLLNESTYATPGVYDIVFNENQSFGVAYSTEIYEVSDDGSSLNSRNKGDKNNFYIGTQMIFFALVSQPTSDSKRQTKYNGTSTSGGTYNSYGSVKILGSEIVYQDHLFPNRDGSVIEAEPCLTKQTSGNKPMISAYTVNANDCFYDQSQEAQNVLYDTVVLPEKTDLTSVVIELGVEFVFAGITKDVSGLASTITKMILNEMVKVKQNETKTVYGDRQIAPISAAEKIKKVNLDFEKDFYLAYKTDNNSNSAFAGDPTKCIRLSTRVGDIPGVKSLTADDAKRSVIYEYNLSAIFKYKPMITNKFHDKSIGFDYDSRKKALELKVCSRHALTYDVGNLPTIKMTESTKNIFEGSTVSLVAKCSEACGNCTVTWSSSNTNIAKVDSNGKVTAVAKGSATITAKTTVAGVTLQTSCKVNVSSFAPSIGVQKTPTSIKATWTSNSSAKDYRVKLFNSSNAEVKSVFTGGANSYTFTGLSQGSKYTVKVQACIAKGSASGCSNAVSKSTFTPYKDLSKYTLTVNDASYTGKAIVPYVTVKDSNGNTLVKDTDYTVSCSNNVNVSSNAVVTVTAKGNYTGKLTKNFTIKYAAASVSNFRVTAKTPTTITLAWNKSSNADGYQITINDITNKGNQITTTKTITSRDTLTYKITGVKEGNCYAITLRPYVNSNSGRLYGATACLSDVVYPPFADLSDNYIIKLSSDKMTYVGKPCRPSVTVKDLNNNVLKKDTDYTVSYSRDSIAGTAKVTVKGKGNYKGTTSKNYTIVYGTLATPKNFKVTSKLPEKIGLSWSAVTNAAGYTIEVRDITSKGNQILKTYNATGTSYTTYGLSGGHEYSIGVKAYFNDQNGGKHYGTSASLGDVVYTPCKNVDEYNISVVPKSCIYSGSAAKPSVRLTDVNGHKLVKDTDFTVSYSNNVNIGTATIKITGKGNYAGTDTVTFKITPPSMSAPSNFKVVSKTPEKITLSWSNQPQITGYQVEVRDITNKGNQITKTYTTTATTYTATGLTGGHEYSVSVKAYFQDKLGKKYYGPVSSLSNLVYTPFKNVDEYNISVVPKSGIYSGSAIKPSVRLTDLNGNKLVKDTDFTVSYSNNVNIGTATIKITGKGNYAGTDTVTFKITPPSMSAPSSFKVVSKTPEKITLSWSNQPQITGYQLDVRDITNKGNQITKTYTTTATTYTATGLTGGHEYAISVKAYFQDKLGKKYYGPSTALGDVVYTPYKYIYDYNVTMTAKSWVYTGNEAKPSVKVVDLNGHKLVKDTDYTVTYSNNVNIGTATAKITGKGNYAGSDTITFKIVAPSMSAPSSFKVVSKTSNSINLSWGGQPQITGYQIDVRDITNKGNQILKSYTTTGVKYTVSNLTKYHEYAINVRAYVQDKTGTKYYGPWASLGDTVYL